MKEKRDTKLLVEEYEESGVASLPSTSLISTICPAKTVNRN